MRGIRVALRITIAVSGLAAAIVLFGYFCFASVFLQRYVPPPNQPGFHQLELTVHGGRLSGVWTRDVGGVVLPIVPGWHLNGRAR